MDVRSYSDARANLGALFSRVVEDHTPLAIVRQKARAVVVVSLSDGEAMQRPIAVREQEESSRL